MSKRTERNESTQTLIVKALKAREVELECPHCGEIESGFWGNPIGRKFKCESCFKFYKVDSEATVHYAKVPRPETTNLQTAGQNSDLQENANNV